MRDPYEVLGIPHTASKEEIKKTYKKLVLQYHPDKTGGDKAKSQRFVEVQAAYEWLISNAVRFPSQAAQDHQRRKSATAQPGNARGRTSETPHREPHREHRDQKWNEQSPRTRSSHQRSGRDYSPPPESRRNKSPRQTLKRDRSPPFGYNGRSLPTRTGRHTSPSRPRRASSCDLDHDSTDQQWRRESSRQRRQSQPRRRVGSPAGPYDRSSRPSNESERSHHAQSLNTSKIDSGREQPYHHHSRPRRDHQYEFNTIQNLHSELLEHHATISLNLVKLSRWLEDAVCLASNSRWLELIRALKGDLRQVLRYLDTLGDELAVLSRDRNRSRGQPIQGISHNRMNNSSQVVTVYQEFSRARRYLMEADKHLRELREEFVRDYGRDRFDRNVHFHARKRDILLDGIDKVRVLVRNLL